MLCPQLHQIRVTTLAVSCRGSGSFGLMTRRLMVASDLCATPTPRGLTPECIRALTRIFRICDIDNDGYLSDKELEAFQERCFAIPLTAQSLHDVKQLPVLRNTVLCAV
ncbi:unnamed protein product [Dibothriocephalus latus]|uniref:EF-hand domain-containing protein n=1 Tax=Dibothriocephalus latus TaxID=60516 RepID=A0A3P6R629_DIBLA|nr:unnamed protein product [Dibothriocephalus latus]